MCPQSKPPTTGCSLIGAGPWCQRSESLRRCDGDVGVCEGDAAVTPTRFHQDLCFLRGAQVYAHALPLPEVLGNGDVATLARVLSNGDDLLEVAVGPRDVGQVLLVAGVEVVLGTVEREVASQLVAEGLRGAVAEGILDDVVLDERIRRPTVDPDEGEAARAPLPGEPEVRSELAQLRKRLRLVKPEPDACQEVAGVVPLGTEGSAEVIVGGHAAAAARVPKEPVLLGDGALVVRLTSLEPTLERRGRPSAV